MKKSYGLFIGGFLLITISILSVLTAYKTLSILDSNTKANVNKNENISDKDDEKMKILNLKKINKILCLMKRPVK